MNEIPFRHDCSEDINDYSLSVQRFREALYEPGIVNINLSQVQFLRPFGLNLLSGMIYDLLIKGQEVSLTPPGNQRVEQYLTDQGFYKEFRIGVAGRLCASPRSTSVGLHRLDELDYDYLLSVVHWLKGNSPIPLESIQDMVMLTMPEVINNVFDHSRSPFGCYVCAEAYPPEQRLMLSVIDFGVGFFNSLSPRYRQISTNADAIALAVKPGVSSKPNPRNAGSGLDVLSGWVRTTGGQLEIISIDGHWILDSEGGTETRTISFDFPGSCINLSIHTSNLRDYDSTERRQYD